MLARSAMLTHDASDALAAYLLPIVLQLTVDPGASIDTITGFVEGTDLHR